MQGCIPGQDSFLYGSFPSFLKFDQQQQGRSAMGGLDDVLSANSAKISANAASSVVGPPVEIHRKSPFFIGKSSKIVFINKGKG